MRRLHHLTAASLVLAVTTLASRSQADDADLQGLLDEPVVSTASMVSEPGSTAPATSSTLTAEDMRRYGIHTIEEAIAFLGLGASSGAGLGLGVRGVHIEQDTGEHFLLLVDGHAVNEAYYGGASLGSDAGVPFELIDHIEFMLGPSSVLYGSNAMLGVVNVITKRAKDFHGVRVGAESNVPYGGRVWTGAGYEFKLLGAPSELTFQLEYGKSSGPNLRYPVQDTGIDPVTGKLARYSTSPQGTGIWGGQATSSAFAETPALYARLVSGNFELTVNAASAKNAAAFDFGHFDDPMNRTIGRRLFVDLKHHAALSTVVGVNTRVYADTSDTQAFVGTSLGHVCPYEGGSCLEKSIGGSRWAGVEVQTTFDWLKDGRLVTLVGVDPRVRSAQGKTDVLNETTGAPLAGSVGVIDRTDATLGAYVQQTWQPFPWLGLNGGARLDATTRFDPVVSPRLGASAKVWRGGVLKAIYSQAFRAPSFFETDFTHPLQPLAVGLRPERVRSVEVSLEQRFGAQRFLFGMFRSTWTDIVALNYFTSKEAAEFVRSGQSALPPVSQFRNIDSIQNFGFNTGYEGSLAQGALRYGANVTAAIARTNEGAYGESPLATAPRFFGNARISYALPAGLPTVGLVGLFASKVPTENAYDGGFKQVPYAPPLLELRLTLSGDVPVLTKLSYRVSADYQFADRNARIIGPLDSYSVGHPTPDLKPISQFATTVGLQYQF